MSTKQPVIKFSPFEALLIGEKNKILKRQPMKNTIFVTRLNQQHKTINLRDLFGLEDITKPESKDVVFKMPQRVRDFLRNRKLRNKNRNTNANKQEDILCYEFEGQKMILKNNEKLKQISKKAKIKSNKVKFKRKFKCKENLREKFAKKFHNCSRKRHCYRSRHRKVLPRLSPRDVNKKKYENRHLLRGKDGKFVRKSEYDNLNLKECNTKRKYLAKYLHQLYLKKKNKEFFHKNKLKNCTHLNNNQMPYNSAEVKLTDLKKQSDQTLPEMYFDCDPRNEFKFPQFPKQLASKSDFEDDTNVIDLIYENFPKSLKFQCKHLFDDFSEALKSAGIIKREKNLKMYGKKKNESFKGQELRVIFNHQIPCIHLRRLDNIKSNLLPLNSIRNGYGSVIDEPFTKNSQLITGKSIGNLFFRSVEGKDIFVGNVVKPFFQNSWFGSLPEF